METETTIREKILDVLRAADRPMKALEIARKIPGNCEKKDVNREIHHMREVERTNPGQNPPLWQLYTGAASSTTPQSQSGVASSARGPATLGQVAAGGQGNVASGGSDASLASQLSGITIGDEGSATWNNELLATVKPVEGGIVIKPVSRDAIISQAVGRSSDCDRDEPSEHHPVQETGCTNVAELEGENVTSSSQTIDPVNLSNGHELKKLLDKETGDNPSKKQKEYASQVLDKTIHTEKTHCSSASCQQPSLSTPSKLKRKPVIAAKFGDIETPQAQPLKLKILDILTQEGQPLDTFEVSKRLGHKDRVPARRTLEELQREDKVYEVVQGGVSYWSVKVSK